MIEDQKHEKNSKMDEGNVDEHFAIMEASLIKYMTLVGPTHSSSTCFMRTDTLHTSLVTTVLPQGKASRHMQAFKLRKKENKKEKKERKKRSNEGSETLLRVSF